MLTCALLACVHSVHADGQTERRKAQFAAVQRIAVVPPFYGTGRFDRPASPDAPPENAKLTRYLDQLRKLQAHVASALPERVAARTTYKIVSAADLSSGFKSTGLRAESLFKNSSRMKGSRFAEPDAAAVRKLAAALHADAVVLATLDEPRRSGDRVIFDPLSGLGIDPAHAGAKIGFWVALADGTQAYQRVSEVNHPVTRVGSREFVYADWEEATDLAIENFLDELTRYTPEAPAKK